MATRVLGIKYELVGYKEAVESFKQIKRNLNEQIAASKTNFTASLKNAEQFANSEEYRAEAVEKANQRIFFSYLGLRARVKKESAGLFDDVVKNIKSSSRKVQNEIRDSWISAFGTKTEKQKLIIRQEKADFSQRQTYKNLTIDTRNLVLEFRLVTREFFADLEKLLEKSFPDNKFDKVGGVLTAPIKFAAEAIAFPFQATLFGAFQRIGEVQTEDFAVGFSKKLQKSLGLQFEEVGADVGDIFGEGIYRIYESILQRTKEGILSDLDDKTPQVKDFIEDIKNVFVGSFIKALAIPVKAHKRIQLTKKAIPKTLEQAGELLVNQEITSEQREEIEKQNSISLLVGGVNMDADAKNTEFVEKLLKEYLEDTFVVAIKNFWSNSKVGKEYKDIVNKIIKNILTNPATSGGVQSFLKDRGLVDAMKKMDGVDEIDEDKLVETIIDFLDTKDIPLIKLLETAFEGYNADDIMIAAQAMFYKQQFPDKPVNIIGTSAGGFNAAGALEILNKLGYNDIKAAGITTPVTGLEFTGDTENYLASIGTEDFLYKALFEGIFKNFLIPPEVLQVIQGAGQKHLLPLFMADPKFKARFLEFFKGRLNIKKGIDSGAMGYITRRVQNPEDENLQRTLLKLMGQETDDGYTFNFQDLKGLTREIKKKANRIQDKDIKAEAEVFIDFLETLAEELEIIEVVGDQVKPLKSIQKASKIYANQEIKDLAQSSPTPQAEKSKNAGKKQLQENKKFIDFKKHLKNESWNIEQTIKALLGEEIEGYSFFDSTEYQDRADNHLGGLINYLENVLLSGASSKQKGKSFKYLDFLKRLQKAIIAYGKDGIKPSEDFLKEAQKLFSFSQPIATNNVSKKQYLKQKNRLRQARGSQPAQAFNDDEALSSEVQEEIDIDPEEIITLYREYLQSIVDNASEKAKQKIIALTRSNFDFNLEELFDDLRRPEELMSVMEEYRQAFRDGRIRGIKYFGEKLLEDLEIQKVLIRQTAQSILNNPRASAQEREIAKRKGSAAVAYMSRLQREISIGDQSRLDNTGGLVRLAQSSEFQNLIVEMRSLGAQARAGFNRGFNEDSEKIAETFVDTVAETVIEGFDIQSPSKVFEWIGKQVKAGFELGVRGLLGTTRAELEGIDEVVNQSGVNNTFNDIFADAILNVRKFFDELQDSSPIFARLKSAALGLFGVFIQIVGIFSIGDLMRDLVISSLDVARSFESMKNSIIASSGGLSEGLKNLQFIRSEARRLNIDLATATETYSKLIGATKNTPLEGEAIKQIYSAFAEAAKLRGLKPEETTRLFMGIEQSIAKGKLQSEEIKGQISDVPGFGDIQNLIAQSLGVGVPQLQQMMQDGSIKADTWTKVASALQAQNAIAPQAQTAQSALNNFNNSLTEFKKNLGEFFQPIQKLGLNILAAGFDFLGEKAVLLTKALMYLITIVLVNLIGLFVGSRAALILFGQALDGLINLIVTSLPKLLLFLQRFILITAAIETWLNVLKLTKNAFPELQADIEGATLGLEQLKIAFDEAGKSGANFGRNLPKNTGDIELQEGWKVPKEFQGLAGGERLNLDNLFRRRFKKFNSGLKNNPILALLAYGTYGMTPEKQDFTTEAERRQQDFGSKVNDLISSASTNKNQFEEVKKPIADIEELNARLSDIKSAEFSLLPGDREGREKLIKEQQEILKERDKLLKITSTYTNNLNQDIEEIKRAIAQLDYLAATGQITESEEKKQRQKLTDFLEALGLTKKGIDDLLSVLSRQLSELERRIRNTNERVAGFIEKSDRASQRARTEIITEGVNQGKSDQVIQLELNDISKRDLQNRINFLKKELRQIEKDLKSPALAPAIERLEKQAKEQGLDLYTNDTIERMLAEEGRDKQDIEALNYLKTLKSVRGQLSDYREQLVQTIQQNRYAVFDLVRGVNDFFFRITQQIKETIVEIERIGSQLFYGDIKGKLRRAIVPGSDSFINGIIESIQGFIDQAQSIAEKVYGQASAKIGFETEQFNLQNELQDFARSVAGAAEAVLQFKNSLLGGSTEANPSSFSTNGVRSNQFPVPGLSLSTANITSNYGWRNIFGRKDFHEGIDIASPGGTKVVAANSGVVKAIKPLADQTQVMIESITAAGEKIQEWYIHLDSKLNVALGDRVVAGQQIGKVATTTSAARNAKVSTGDHLDYRVKVNDKWVDPKQFLSKTRTYQAGEVSSPVLSSPIADFSEARIKAFLATIGYSEGADYNTMFSGKTFNSYADHPRQVITSGGYSSSAAGRYQILNYVWDNLKKRLGLPDFSPASQDKAAIELIREKGALEDVIGGNFEAAINKLGSIWASFPSSGYGQPTKSMSDLKNFYQGQLSFDRSKLGSDDELISQANQLQQEYLKLKEQTIGLNSVSIQQEQQLLDLQIQQQIQAQERQFEDQNRVNKNASFDLENKFTDFTNQYNYQTAQTEASKQIRDLQSSARDFNQQLFESARKYQDFLKGANQFLQQVPAQIEALRSRGLPSDLANADLLEATANQIKTAIPEASQYLQQIEAITGKLPDATKAANDYLEYQNELRLKQEDLQKVSNQLALKSQIAESSATLEIKKQLAIDAERVRLQQRLVELQRQYPEGEDLDRLINLEKEASSFNLKNIDFDYLNKELSIKQQYRDIRAQRADKKANFLQSIGLTFDANKLQRDNAILAENLRYRQQLAQIEKDFAGDAQKLKEFKKAAQELNQVNLASIKQQFKDVGATIQSELFNSFSSFLSNAFTNFLDPNRDRAILEQRLAYAEELNSLQEQYAEEPNTLAELKNRLKELNNEKLDKLNNEFNIFNRVVNFAREALLQFVKAMAQMAAQQLAGAIFKSVLGGLAGGTTGIKGGSGAGVLIAKHGATIPNFDKGGKIIKNGRNLTGLIPGLSEAFNKEGHKGVLAVFTPGEEILSIETGEAGRYQALKRRYGNDPLAKIPNFATGGTIASNLISDINYQMPEINVRAIPEVNLINKTQQGLREVNKTINMTVVTPNADSFRSSEFQRNQDLVERFKRLY